MTVSPTARWDTEDKIKVWARDEERQQEVVLLEGNGNGYHPVFNIPENKLECAQEGGGINAWDSRLRLAGVQVDEWSLYTQHLRAESEQTENVCLSAGEHTLHYSGSSGGGWQGGAIQVGGYRAFVQNTSSVSPPAITVGGNGSTSFFIDDCVHVMVNVTALDPWDGTQISWKLDDGPWHGGPLARCERVQESLCLEAGSAHSVAYFATAYFVGFIEVPGQVTGQVLGQVPGQVPGTYGYEVLGGWSGSTTVRSHFIVGPSASPDDCFDVPVTVVLPPEGNRSDASWHVDGGTLFELAAYDRFTDSVGMSFGLQSDDGSGDIDYFGATGTTWATGDAAQSSRAFATAAFPSSNLLGQKYRFFTENTDFSQNSTAAHLILYTAFSQELFLGRDAWFDYLRIDGSPGGRPICAAGSCNPGSHRSYIASALADTDACTPCAIHTHDHDEDPATPCINCAVGFYTTGLGSTACLPCTCVLPTAEDNPDYILHNITHNLTCESTTTSEISCSIAPTCASGIGSAEISCLKEGAPLMLKGCAPAVPPFVWVTYGSPNILLEAGAVLSFCETTTAVHEVICCSESPLLGFHTRWSALGCQAYAKSMPPNVATEGCTYATGFAAAYDTCSAVGARICTAAELLQGCGATCHGNPACSAEHCNYDDAIVWTADACTRREAGIARGKQAIVAMPPTRASNSPSWSMWSVENLNSVQAMSSRSQCVAVEGERHAVRCCSSVDPGSSRYDTNRLAADGLTACGATWSTSYFPTYPGGCVADATLAQAASYCDSDGARLCTSLEIESGCADTNACAQLNRKMIWTIDSCDSPPEYAWLVQADGEVDESTKTRKCAPTSDLSSVRCCSDTDISGFVQAGGCLFWSGTNNETACGMSSTYMQAALSCARVGARLCNATELLSGCGVWKNPEGEQGAPTPVLNIHAMPCLVLPCLE